jgi:HTH-type transcriptional regulator / antitoxin HigA
MKPKIIKNDKAHQAALARVEALWDAPKGSRQADELEHWAILIEAYEKKRYPIEEPDPVDAILFRMDQMGLKPTDLAKYLGGRNRVSEVLNRKRPLSVAMMRSLYQNLHIPAESLLAEPKASYRVR